MRAAKQHSPVPDWNGTVGGNLKIYHELAGEQVETEIPAIKDDTSKLFDKKIPSFFPSFLGSVKNGESSPVPSSQIIYNQAIIDGIARSSELGREIEINIPEF